MTLSLEVRTPTGLTYSGAVSSIRAEDADGWVGIRPGRRDLVLALLPGLLLFEDDQGEAFVANGGGTLNLEGSRCRVATISATLYRTTVDVSALLEERGREQAERRRHARDLSGSLIEEAVHRATTGHGWARGTKAR